MRPLQLPARLESLQGSLRDRAEVAVGLDIPTVIPQCEPDSSRGRPGRAHAQGTARSHRFVLSNAER